MISSSEELIETVIRKFQGRSAKKPPMPFRIGGKFIKIYKPSQKTQINYD